MSIEPTQGFSVSRKANFGCGPLPLYPQDIRYMGKDWQSWLLIDKYIEGPHIVNWDIEVLDEVPDEYLEEIFCSHALEHISHRKVVDILKLWYRKLGDEGKLTIIVPDLMYALKQLQKMENDQIPEGYYDAEFGLKSPLSIIYGTHSQPGEYHLSGWTERLMHTALEEAGFNPVVTHIEYEDHQMDCIIAKAYK